MTRIAIISDIHGNVPALEAVLDDLAVQEPDEVLVGGDLVGRGPQGSAVVQRISELGLPSIRGNHEDYLLGFRHEAVPDDWLTAAVWSASRWMAAELDQPSVDYIESLPFSLQAQTVRGVRLVHGTPRSNEEGIGPWSREDEIEDHLASVVEPVLVCAHTHRPLIHESEQGLVVNVGSVAFWKRAASPPGCCGWNWSMPARCWCPFSTGRSRWAGRRRRTRSRRSWSFIPPGSRCGTSSSVWRRWGEDPFQSRVVGTRTATTDERFLEEGGVTARLLRMELEHACPLLVPFLYWAEQVGRPPEEDQIEAFLELYTPGQPLRDFFERLAALG